MLEEARKSWREREVEAKVRGIFHRFWALLQARGEDDGE
jgi:hypothetical protein